MENDHSFCPQCGSPLTPEAQFCARCGAACISPDAARMQQGIPLPCPVPAQEAAAPGFVWNWGKGIHGILSIVFPLLGAVSGLMLAQKSGVECGFFEGFQIMFIFMCVSIFFYGFTRAGDLVRFIRSNKTTNAISGFIGGIIKFLTVLYTLAAGLPILGLILGLALGMWVVMLASPVFWVLDLIFFIRIRMQRRKNAA